MSLTTPRLLKTKANTAAADTSDTAVVTREQSSAFVAIQWH